MAAGVNVTKIEKRGQATSEKFQEKEYKNKQYIQGMLQV